MKKLPVLFSLVLTLFLVQCKDDKKEEKPVVDGEETVDPAEENKVQKIKVLLEPKSDSQLRGNVVFSEENGKVTMTALITGTAEGKHAIHLHEKADCSSADGKSSGGHWNPTFAKHGQWGDADGFHIGDIGNFETDANGNAVKTMTTDLWCLGCDDPKKNIIGKAVIVHEGVDDYTSQPSGAAGSRIGCGGIISL